MVHGVHGQSGRTAMAVPVPPHAPENAIALLPCSAVCPALGRADRAVVAMTTSPSVQVSTGKQWDRMLFGINDRLLQGKC